jgi:hypothetical protein
MGHGPATARPYLSPDTGARPILMVADDLSECRHLRTIPLLTSAQIPDQDGARRAKPGDPFTFTGASLCHSAFLPPNHPRINFWAYLWHTFGIPLADIWQTCGIPLDLAQAPL